MAGGLWFIRWMPVGRMPLTVLDGLVDVPLGVMAAVLESGERIGMLDEEIYYFFIPQTNLLRHCVEKRAKFSDNYLVLHFRT